MNTTATKTTSKVATKKFLALHEVMDVEKGAIWVLNTSERVSDGVRGDVFLQCMQGSQPVNVRIPSTWLPVELTAWAPRKALLESRYFTDAVRKEVIQLVTPEWANQQLDGNDARAEQKRLRDREAQIEQATAGKILKPEVVRRNVDARDIIDDSTDSQASPITARFVSWVNKLNEQDEDAARLTIRNKGDMTRAEAAYLADNLKHEKLASGVRKLVAAQDANQVDVE